MFYRPGEGCPLPHNPFNAIVSPRPIGWISTRDGRGCDNLAPYSFFNAVAYVPPQVMFASTSAKEDQDNTKDTVANIRETGVFCVNVTGADMAAPMNASSADLERDVDEFTHAGVEKLECESIPCARVAGVPAALECEMRRIIKIEGAHNYVVLGEVVGVHLREDTIRDGRFDLRSYRPLARLGYHDYTVVENIFELKRPAR